VFHLQQKTDSAETAMERSTCHTCRSARGEREKKVSILSVFFTALLLIIIFAA
jgi:hypothetical protein